MRFHFKLTDFLYKINSILYVYKFSFFTKLNYIIEDVCYSTDVQKLKPFILSTDFFAVD